MCPMPSDKYHKTRHRYDPGRQRVWTSITEYLQRFIGEDKVILDLGCGYGDFINLVDANRKYAIDISPSVKKYISSDVTFINRPSSSLSTIDDGSIDAIFSSNLLEHLDEDQLDATIKEMRRCLNPSGIVILIGPNFRYAYKRYFDDYTHKKIFTHISLADLMSEYGFTPTRVIPKFLPLTLQSILPKSRWLTWIYIRSPFRPLGKQMLLIFEVTNGS